MNKYLADTTVLIDSLRYGQSATLFLKTELPAISCVSVAELIQGCKNSRQLQSAKKLYSCLEIFPLYNDVSSRALELLEKHFLSQHLKFLDALIAATAINLNLTLVTSNAKHFSFISNLKLIPWQTLEKTLTN